MGHYCAAVARGHDDFSTNVLEELKRAKLLDKQDADGHKDDVLFMELSEYAFKNVLEAEVSLAKLSKKYDLDIVWVLVESATDVFRYSHWQSGKILRNLVCGDVEEGCWTTVSGEPEEWEIDAFAGEEVEHPDGEVELLGWNESAETVVGPIKGDYTIAPDAQKYGKAAIAFYTAIPSS